MSVAGRLLCVSLATALDRYAEVDALTVGGVNRPRIVLELAGGKGFNAARSAIALGVRTRVLGLTGGPTGRQVQELAEAEGITVRWVDGRVNTRQCLSLVDRATGELTEFYEPVLPLAQEVWPLILTAFEDELSELGSADLVALSRLPHGLPADALAQLIRRCRSADVQVAVDAYGPELATALAERPTLVKVNESEARAISANTTGSVTDVAQQILSLGADSVIITRGAAGSVYADLDRCVTVEHPAVPGGLAVGSGDAFLGALSVVLTRTFIPTETVAALPRARISRMLSLAAAAGMANARQLPAGQIDWVSITSEVKSVQTRAVS